MSFERFGVEALLPLEIAPEKVFVFLNFFKRVFLTKCWPEDLPEFGGIMIGSFWEKSYEFP